LPEQIAGRLKSEKGVALHHGSIYRYVERNKLQGGTLHKYLLRAHKPYKKQYGSNDKRGQCANPRSELFAS